MLNIYFSVALRNRVEPLAMNMVEPSKVYRHILCECTVTLSAPNNQNYVSKRYILHIYIYSRYCSMVDLVEYAMSVTHRSRIVYCILLLDYMEYRTTICTFARSFELHFQRGRITSSMHKSGKIRLQSTAYSLSSSFLFLRSPK